MEVWWGPIWACAWVGPFRVVGYGRHKPDTKKKIGTRLGSRVLAIAGLDREHSGLLREGKGFAVSRLRSSQLGPGIRRGDV